jgi:hypothetical protein
MTELTPAPNPFPFPLGICLVLQMAQLGADEPVSRAIILASQADKSATSSEPLEPCLKWPKTQSW